MRAGTAYRIEKDKVSFNAPHFKIFFPFYIYFYFKWNQLSLSCFQQNEKYLHRKWIWISEEKDFSFSHHEISSKNISETRREFLGKFLPFFLCNNNENWYGKYFHDTINFLFIFHLSAQRTQRRKNYEWKNEKRVFFCVSMLLLIKIILRIHEKRKTLLGFFSCFFFFIRKIFPLLIFHRIIASTSATAAASSQWTKAERFQKNDGKIL